MNDKGSFFVSKELADLLSDTDEEIHSVNFGDSKIVIAGKKYSAGLKRIKVNEFTLELVAKFKKEDCIEIISNSIDKEIKVPSILKDAGSLRISEVELNDEWFIKIIAVFMNS